MKSQQFKINDPVYFDGYDHDSKLSKTLVNSSKRRGISPFRFALRKTKNIVLARLAYFCPLNSWRVAMHRMRGVHIGKDVYIGQQCTLDNAYPEYIYIEDGVGITNETMIISHITAMPPFRRIIKSGVEPVLIKKGASVFARCVILPGVTVGEYSIVSAGSVVLEDVDDFSFVRGNPAIKISKVSKKRVTYINS